MKRLIAAFLVTAGLATTMIAFADTDRENHKQERLIKKLNLTDERAEEVKAVMTEFHAKKRAIHENTRDQMEALMTDQKTALAGVLTAEEMDVVEKKLNKRGKHKNKFSRCDKEEAQ